MRTAVKVRITDDQCDGAGGESSSVLSGWSCAWRSLPSCRSLWPSRWGRQGGSGARSHRQCCRGRRRDLWADDPEFPARTEWVIEALTELPVLFAEDLRARRPGGVSQDMPFSAWTGIPARAAATARRRASRVGISQAKASGDQSRASAICSSSGTGWASASVRVPPSKTDSRLSPSAGARPPRAGHRLRCPTLSSSRTSRAQAAVGVAGFDVAGLSTRRCSECRRC